MSEALPLTTSSFFLTPSGKSGRSTRSTRRSSKPSSVFWPMNSSKRSCFSTSTVKPSFFSMGLEAFTKPSIYKKESTFNELINLAELEFYDEYEEPVLENWDRWLSIHQEQQEDLSQKLHRPVQCLVMNTTLNNLSTNQEKGFITEASNIVNFDKARGHPNFWKPDDAAVAGRKKLGVYQTIQQKYDRSRQNYVPQNYERTYVGIPKKTLEEKNIHGLKCLPTSIEEWNKSSYVKSRKKMLEQELLAVQSHTPDCSELAIVGHSVKRLHQFCYDDDSLEESVQQETPTPTNTLCSQDDGDLISDPICVTIDNEMVPKNLKLWEIHFDDCYVNGTYEKSMVITNLDESCLKYSWQIVFPSWLNTDLPLKQMKNRKKGFYFNKNDGAILPKKETEIIFCFNPKIPGVFKEKWEFMMSLAPDKWDTVVIELQAVAVEDSSCMDNLSRIDSYIEACTRLTIAKKAVKEILDRSRPPCFQQLPYDSNFFEEQIFIYNNPDLFYDGKHISTFKCLNKKVCEGPWDFSVINLRSNLLNHIDSSVTREDIELFTSTVLNLLKPTSTISLLNEKQKSVYELLCCLINKIETEAMHLKNVHNIPVNLKFKNEVVAEKNISRNVSKDFVSKGSQISKKSGKKFSLKTKLSKPSTLTLDDTIESRKKSKMEFFSSSSMSTVSDQTMQRRNQEYLEALFVKTYFHLSRTIDHIVAVMESFDSWNKKSVLTSLKNKNF